MGEPRSNEYIEHRRRGVKHVSSKLGLWDCSNRSRFLLDFEMTLVTWDRTVF